MEWEFMQFLNTIKRLGIPFKIDWGPTKEEWQQLILDAGYHVTALACQVIEVGETEYLFSAGPIGWTKDDMPVGPSGLLLFGRKKSGEIVPRRLLCSNNSRGNSADEPTNYEAVKIQYPADWDLAITKPQT